MKSGMRDRKEGKYHQMKGRILEDAGKKSWKLKVLVKG